ncbi:MAG TPA: type I pantothenate kinase, partial [Thermoanaerobaculia bacterium]|nr:type I pantothenate kinase [Thermoanaerobaculia bacterium]
MSDSSPYLAFSRDEWAELRAGTPLTLTQKDLDELRGINESVSMQEVEEVYLPLSRLLNLHISAVRELRQVTSTFLGSPASEVPYVVAIAGSVSVGKSTTARILRTLLSRWPDHPRVELITTDGFLYPNQVLEARGLMQRKGFPESYDLSRLLQFVSDLKSGQQRIEVPIYSHLIYDIIPDRTQVVESTDIVILEGLNVLQSGTRHPLFVSDFIDFSIYVDAAEEHLQQWFLSRFRRLREGAFRDPSSYFRYFTEMSEKEALEIAVTVWEEINLR